MKLNTTKYYEEFLRYTEMATWQQENCNLGNVSHTETPYDDDLIKVYPLYDVVERKYAGFSQLMCDTFYSLEDHPYKNHMDNSRKELVKSFSNSWGMEENMFVFFVHRLTGSGINYARTDSGYVNSVILGFTECKTIEDMVEVIQNHQGPMFTSVGYQIAPFPKPKGDYEKGGIWFMCEELPELTRRFVDYMSEGGYVKTFRMLMDWLEAYNQSKGWRVFRFQYAATLADIADFYPKWVIKESHFFYGKNAIECLSYLAEKPNGTNKFEYLDAITEKILEDTGALPYNSEDIACDFIRWVENYINPKGDYQFLDLDNIWSSHTIKDHPYGRQKPMLDLGLVQTFNGFGHPSDDKIIKSAGVTEEDYKLFVELGKLPGNIPGWNEQQQSHGLF